MRGGVSLPRNIRFSRAWSSPHAWGCFPLSDARGHLRVVFPTCVGVFLTVTEQLEVKVRLPHMRGGVSKPVLAPAIAKESSPHAWGCFRQRMVVVSVTGVFPTCVGVFLAITVKPAMRPRLPHMRGGVSTSRTIKSQAMASSPHAWGCFCRIALWYAACAVFPTCVGVFPIGLSWSEDRVSLPHMRGGVSALRPQL
ncbi:Domain of uncharacterised function (DUF2825) [Klebsiella pneumoniae]|uniref:Domain of uncharacterized function (DUF2825) n=1 Tax=Klebsiella pneumoniae TaxID=573 RepID=A0A2X1QI47_KLEPN|nr:Domain of uncharacterised function (DUF2825) [Klebsiella pneumoniae]